MSDAPWSEWAALALALGVWSCRGLRVRWLARHRPQALAAAVNAALRERWVLSLAMQPGSELLAVQTLRNSLMSATVVASTSALLLTGLAGMLAGLGADVLWTGPGQVRPLVLLMLALTLFAAFAASALATRLLHHVGYMLASPVGSALRAEVLPEAARALGQAGRHYGTGLRCLLVAPALALGLLWPLALPAAAVVTVVALIAFDRPSR